MGFQPTRCRQVWVVMGSHFKTATAQSNYLVPAERKQENWGTWEKQLALAEISHQNDHGAAQFGIRN